MQIQENLTEKAGVQHILAVPIALNLHKHDRQVSSFCRRLQDAINAEAGLLDFLRGKTIGDLPVRRSANQVKDNVGISLKDFVEEAVGFQTGAIC